MIFLHEAGCNLDATHLRQPCLARMASVIPSNSNLAVKDAFRQLCREDVAHHDDPNEQKVFNDNWIC